tara:strand:+ start:187 stop:744 length:558 start_codon:yes stop_codon:yes gene_type:complete
VNDPFELLGIELGDKSARRAVNFEKTKISNESGLICFSEDKYNPVQWANYADKHKGICLGFEVSEKLVRKVKYILERLDKSTLDEPDCNEKLITTKFKHWEYEKERRLLLKLSDYPKNSEGYRFKSFNDTLSLKEVYIGCKSKVTYKEIASEYSSTDNSVVVKYTRPAFRDFRIVWDQSKKSIRI